MAPIQTILILIIRLWAAGVIFSSFLGITYWPIEAWGGFNALGEYTIRAYINTGVWLALGGSAWALAPRLARMVYKPAPSSSSDASHVDADVLVMAGSFLIGGFYLVEHLPHLVVSLAYIFIELNQQDSSVTRAFGRPQINPLWIE